MTYKPTTEEVRSMYGGPRYEPEFDRWLAAHDAEVRAQALREAADEAERHADEGCPSCSNNPVSACSGATNLTAAWLRSRAEQTKEGR